MVENRILIAVDFTAAAEKAVEFGIYIANKMHANISLLHVFEDEGMTMEECEDKLSTMATEINNNNELHCDFICEAGSIFEVIPVIGSKGAFRMAVLAAHGRKGFRQKLFGADILKLLKRVPIPVLVVQEGSEIKDTGFKTTIFPVGSHDAYERKIEAMNIIAGLCDPEIHLYSISKPGFEQSDQLRENILLAAERFSEKGINYKRIDEDQNVFSVGFAKQTLKYAKDNNASLISIMVNPTQENSYFADSDKEAILMNEHYIPVLCTSDAEAIL
jgi:nucleotide-binding universal stress UspA family protein